MPVVLDARNKRVLRAALPSVPGRYLECRDLMHAWEVIDDFRAVPETKDSYGYIERTVCCMRCEAVRTERYQETKDGLIRTRTKYEYPAGYTLDELPSGPKPVSIVREELWRRVSERSQSRRRRAA